MTTTNKGLNQPANASLNWDTPLNANFQAIDTALGGVLSLSVTGLSSTPVVLTQAQLVPPIITITGTLTANVTYQVPTGVGGFWTVFNNTLGTFTVTFAYQGGGTTFQVPQLQRAAIACDPTADSMTGVFQMDNTGVAVGGANTQVQFNSGGVLAGSNRMIFDGTNLLLGAAGSAGAVRLNGSTSGYAGFTAPAAPANVVWTLPAADGTNGQVLTTNGASVLSWGPATGVIGGQFRNLQGSQTNLGQSTAAWTADALTLEDASRNVVRTTSAFNQTLNLTTVGPNGLDVGSVQAGKWYYVWAIWGPSAPSFALLASLSSTSPTLPTTPIAYPFKARIGAVKTDPSSHIVPFIQQRTRVQYVFVSGGTIPLIASGIPSGGSATFQVKDVTVPTTAMSITVTVQNVSAGAEVFAAPSSNYGATFVGGANPASFGSLHAYYGEILLQDNSVFYLSSDASGALLAQGYEDNL